MPSFHRSEGKSYFDTRMISKLLCLHSNAQNFVYFVFICHYLCLMNLKWFFPSQKSSCGKEAGAKHHNILWRIQNFTMLAMKSVEDSMQRLNKKRKVRNLRRKLPKPSNSNGEPNTDREESLKFVAIFRVCSKFKKNNFLRLIFSWS